jgi:H2-forming N5,N10-methylenetetrahydromethanopterin dehydrogenase-like enzyme
MQALILETFMQVQNCVKMSFNNTRQKFIVPFKVVSNVSNLRVIPTEQIQT